MFAGWYGLPTLVKCYSGVSIDLKQVDWQRPEKNIKPQFTNQC